MLLVDKQEGPTSHDVVVRVRRAARTRRVGHAGTLDPFATGLLVCGLGRATRLLRYFSACEKTYRGVLRFGFATDTGDRTGRPLGPQVAATDLHEGRLRDAAATLTGELLQVPPMFSAKKRAGVPLHELARRGVDVPREPVRIRVSGWQLGSLDDDRVGFELTCSAGTYVRVLASDMGSLLGCPAHLHELRRTRVGDLRVEDALSENVLDAESLLKALVPLNDVPLPLATLVLTTHEECVAFRQGRSLSPKPGAPLTGSVGVRDADGYLLGVGDIQADGHLHPAVVLL